MLADLVATWRQLRRSPAHVVIVVISLGVGMAVSAAAFSVVNALAFEERPGIDTRSGLFNIRWNAGAGLLSEHDFEVIERELGTVFSAAAAEARSSVPVVLPSEPITAAASFVSPLYFETLGTQPAHGRLLTPLAGWRGAVVLLLVAAPYLQLPVTVDPEALIFVFCLAIGVIGVSGFAPAWLATRHAIAAGLKDTRDGGIQHKRLRAALVVLQVAVSLLFLFVSALGVRTLHSFVPSLPPGADKAAVARFDLAASHPGLRDSRPFLDGMLARLAGAPGITAAGFADFVRSERGVWYSGPADAGGVRRFATGGHVTPGWFDAFGARLIVGRGFDGSDVDRATAIVNEGMAAMLASGPGSMLGRTLRVSYSADGPQRSVEIVGVVADHLTLQSGRGAPAVYLPMPRVSPASILLVARASDLPAAAAAIKAALVAIDPEIPWVTLTTLEGASGDPLKGLRSGTWIGGGLGLCALVIASIGLHAVLAYMIRRRTHEIGIRLAVGADRKAIVWLVLRQGLGLVLAGTLLGLAAAVPLGHMLRAGFVGLSPVDPVALLAPVPLLFLVGLLAAAVPALRAASVDPIVVLREP